MLTFTLGDLTIHRIGFGAKRLGKDPAAASVLVRRAVELGVDHVDTAAWYPTYADESFEMHDSAALNWANEVLRPFVKDLVVATKVGPTADGMARPEQLRGQVEANLRSLGQDCLDLVYLRQAGLDSVAEHFGVLAEMQRAGLIRHLGLSNIRDRHLAQAQAIAPVVAVQNRYGIDFGRINDDLLAVCGTQGIAFVPFFAVTGTGREVGGLAGNQQVAALANRHGVSEAQLRIAWTLSRGPHVLAIPGTSDIDHLIENMRAGELIDLEFEE